jgi:hypothetical protein
MTRRVRGRKRKARDLLAGLTSILAALCGGTLGACGSGDDTQSVSITSAPAPNDGGADADATAPVMSHEGGTQDVTVRDAGEEAAREGGKTKDAGDGGNGALPSAVFSTAPISVGMVNCSASGTASFKIGNTGTGALTISAATTGSAFSVSPTTLSLGEGSLPATLTITAAVPGSSTAGTPLTGSLNLFTNDATHGNANVAISLSATPVGATIAVAPGDATSVSFPSSEVNTPSTPPAFSLVNTGNATASVTIGAPVPAAGFSLAGQGASATALGPGGYSLTPTFGFTPTSTATVTATSNVTISGVTCGTNVASIKLNGQGAAGKVAGYPTAPISFGFAECGGARPAGQTITLTNTGTVDAHVTLVSAISGAPGFSTSAAVGQSIPANGGTLNVTFGAPPVPSTSPLTAVQATLTVQTDADSSPQTITLSEMPHGAVLGFDTSATPNFGSFGQEVLLQSASQNFSVTNTGNEAADVTLLPALNGAGDAGDDSDAGTPAPFSVSNGSFSVAGGGTQTDSTTYSPTASGNQTATLAIASTSTLCAPLPAPLALSGAGIGGGPTVSPTSLVFPANCGGPTPQAQTFTITNNGSADLNWGPGDDGGALDVTGPGAANYVVSSTPGPGLLEPGATAIVTVTAAALPTPVPDPDPAAFAAQIVITTDVPFDPPHVVSLGETPLGDRLVLSAGRLRFGQFPINTTTDPQTFTVTNNANPGSPAANVSLSLSGLGMSGYTMTPLTLSNIAPGGGVAGPVSVTFDPSSAIGYPAGITIVTTDNLCTIPSGIQVNGTGTQGMVSVSTPTLTFGTDSGDAAGLVNCGATGTPQTFTVSNSGNQSFQITALTLGLGTASPYVVSGVTLPATIAIGGSATITVTPNAIPSVVANPNDASPFTDALTVTTNAALDTPHSIALVMQARGAVIANTGLATTWPFGTIGSGSIGTFANTMTNTGNATVSVALTGLAQPTIFGLQSNPTIVAASSGSPVVTPILGQFSPPSSNGAWTDQGTLVVTATQAFCEPLPASWTNQKISVSGSSDGNPPVRVSGTLTFPATNCGDGAPAGQAITLTNATNQTYAYQATFGSGAFYTANVSLGDGGAGTIPPNGSAMIVVTPQTIVPGPNVVAGSAPYDDDLLVTIQSSPITSFTIPIAWTLNGAMLSLPLGQGQQQDSMGNHFYVADSQSGFEFPMSNTGTASASVSFGAQPVGAFDFSPASPIVVQPGITALPRLSSTSSDATCPALTSGSVTFLYSGPVCQPFQFSQVSIQSCAGTY